MRGERLERASLNNQEADMQRIVVAIVVLTLTFVGIQTTVAQQHGPVVVLTPDQMKWTDGPAVIPGAKSAVIEGNPREAGPFTMRLFLPAGARIAPHVHSGVEHVSVLYGTFNLGHGEKFDVEKLKSLPAGSFVAMPPGHAHFVQIREATVIQLHGLGPWTLTYVDPNDDPTKK
jgi:quercetin dioxygenase-like cupin family protein